MLPPQSSQNTKTIWHYAHTYFNKAREWYTTSNEMAKHLLSIMEESILPRHRNLPWLNKNLVKSIRRWNLVTHFILESLSMQEVKWCPICDLLRLNTSEDWTLQTVSSFGSLLNISSSVHNGSEYCTDPEKKPMYWILTLMNALITLFLQYPHYRLMMKLCTYVPPTFFALLRKSNIIYYKNWTLERPMDLCHFCLHVEAYW